MGVGCALQAFQTLQALHADRGLHYTLTSVCRRWPAPPKQCPPQYGQAVRPSAAQLVGMSRRLGRLRFLLNAWAAAEREVGQGPRHLHLAWSIGRALRSALCSEPKPEPPKLSGMFGAASMRLAHKNLQWPCS